MKEPNPLRDDIAGARPACLLGLSQGKLPDVGKFLPKRYEKRREL
jgi:hypothetical protein